MFVKKNRKTFLKSHLCQWCFNLNKCFNNLNLLTVVKINGQTISYIYDATGVKLQKKVTSGTTITTDYAEGRAYRKQPVAVFSEGASWRWGIYVSNHLQLFNPPEGYVEPINASNYASLFRHTFQYKDHLGNIRLSYKDLNQNTGAISLSIVEEHNYYPFGLKHNGYNGGSNGQRHHKYMFGGKELQDEIVGSNSFEVYDFGARNYDAALGRWMNIDLLADEPEQVDKAPYTAMWNNPIKYNDPDGRCPSCLFGAFVGFAVEIGSQVIANRIEGKSWSVSITDIDLGDVAISTGEGFLTSGTSAVRSVVGKAIVTVGAEVLRNTVDFKKDGVKFKDAKSVVRNTAIGLTTAGASKAIPDPKIKVKAEVTPKQAVKAARETSVVNREGRIEIEKTAKANLKEAKAINKTVSGTPVNTATGAASEYTKRKGDKTHGNGN